MEKILDRKVKMIWDFRGPTAAQMAQHYKKHLEEFAIIEELKFDDAGVQHFSDMHSIAFLAVAEFEMKEVRDLLKPHRGEFLSET
ncbi:hypothetical protein GTQ34_15430 [Muricauda sp. JGD-17]|uniref:Uncharacterized protein n=1 Tax=Flagellimonas ochracea TaxID=2696472 RepID=A0A964TEF1_9FLAO|nr:hypothetical protein [Allomuricauda ochracea]NAY93302.1 hypothetical protein [Allomuricauda ochracea]